MDSANSRQRIRKETNQGQPPRLRTPSPLAWVGIVAFLAFLIHGIWMSGLTVNRILQGVPKFLTFASRAFPPSTSRLGSVAMATLETFEMAVVGTTAGVLFSLSLSVLAARNTAPHPSVYSVARSMISIMRAIPDIVWALIFIVVVGLGPAAGILALIVDSVGFCGRFFAERIEEVDPGVIEALQSTGASRPGVIAGAIIPSCMPSFVATSMFNLESQVRSATALGVVGAGGIGVELSTAMQLFRYGEALTIIIIMFLVVILIERISSMIRKHLI